MGTQLQGTSSGKQVPGEEGGERGKGAEGLFNCHILALDAFFFSTLRSLASNNRVSCGVGLHAKLGVAQLELNYVIPIKAHPNDQ